MGELKSHAHSYGQNCYHFIWGPKYRMPLLKPQFIRKICEGSLRLTALQNKFIIHELKIMEDHIHMFIEIPPTVSVSQAFLLLKGRSSLIMRRNVKWLVKHDFKWSTGKFFRSIGNVTSDTVEHYIAHCQKDYSYFDVKRKWEFPSQARLNSW